MKLRFWDENIEERKRKDGGFQSKRENRLDKWVGNLWEMWEEKGLRFDGNHFLAWGLGSAVGWLGGGDGMGKS